VDQARRKISTYLIIALAFGFSIYFFISPFLDSQDQGQNAIPGINQNPGTVPTLTSDVDTCVTNPTLDCDHEMLQIMKFCKDNKDQHIPVCSDVRVPQYVDQRGLERPIINTGK
jgi:hypothetical protein